MQSCRPVVLVFLASMRLPVAVLCASFVASLVSPAFAGSYTEDFATTAYKDTVNTTADWNTVAGELRLFPFVPTLVGAYNTPGNATGVAVAGDLAFVADGSSGLQIIDISDPTNPTLAGTYNTLGHAYGIAVAGDLAFVADEDGGLRIIDISDPASPTLAGTYNTPGYAYGIAVAGDLAFVGDGSSGLQIIDISDPTHPSLTGTYNTPGNTYGIAVAGDLAFVADEDGGLRIIDISDPANPTFAGAYEAQDDAVYGIAVAGDLAFVADYESGLKVIDISDPTNPTLAGTYNTPGHAYGIAAAGDLAYVADEDGGLWIIDISDPTHPTLTGVYDTPDNAAFGIAVAGDLAFVADSYGGGLQIIDISDPANPTLAGTYNTPGTATGVAVAGDLAFVADYTSGLQLIDISDPANPTLAGTYDTPGNALGIAVAGDLAFVADSYGGGLQIIDISDPANPTLAGAYLTPDYAHDIAVAGDLAFVADHESGLQVIDISDPANPTLAGAYLTPDYAEGIAVAGDLAFVAAFTSGLQIIDISDPANPTLAGTYNTPGALDIAVAGDLAFVADYSSRLLVIDISDPANPTLAGACNTPSFAYGIAVAGDLAFVAAASSGLQIIDISDPTNPTLAGAYNTPGYAYGIAVAGELAFVADGGAGLQVIRVFQSEVDASRNIGQSLAVDGGDDQIRRAQLTCTQTAGVSWELSVDAGTSWQPVTPGDPWTAFPVPGSDLVWRSTHTWSPGLNPTVSDLTIEWLTEYAPITSITDVPDDNGGKVNLTFERSAYDFLDETVHPIVGYAIYRRVDDLELAQQVLNELSASPPEVLNGPMSASFGPDHVGTLGERTFVVASGQTSVGALPPGVWEGAGWVLPTQIDEYTARVLTVTDSTSAGSGWSVFVTAVHTTTPEIWYACSPESAYSVDNIPPGVPQGFAAAYTQGNVDLTWDPAPEPDFQYFRVYRSIDPGFVPAPEHLVHETAETSWQDSPTDPGSVYYKITALDHAGNESQPASSGAVTAVGDGPGTPTVFALRAAVPNPSSAGTHIVFDLPVETPVSLEVFDVSGRLVRTLVRESMPAGGHEVSWDGADESGRRVSAGVYLYRLRAGEFEATRRLVVTQ